MSGHSLELALGSSHREPPQAADLPSSLSVQGQIQQQLSVLDNLRYEGQVLTDKLIKLRSTRQDLEAELFSLKDKRIKLLEVIQHLEDEEMQLVSEVNGVIRFKRRVLQEVPHLEARGRAAASLAVVQDYLLASVQHLETQQLAGDAASTAAAAAAPSWSGTAQVQRPSATWDMRYLPTVLAPKTAASTQTAGDDLLAAQQLFESLKLEASTQQPPEEQQQQPPSKAEPAEQQVSKALLGREYSSNPFAAVTADQLLQMQSQEAGSAADSLPTLPEGQPLPPSISSAYNSSLYRSSEASLRTPAVSRERPLPEGQASGPPLTASQESGSVLSMGSGASFSSGSQRTASITSSRASGAVGLAGSPGSGMSSLPRLPPGAAARHVDDVPAHRVPSRQGSGRAFQPPPPPPPPRRSNSGIPALSAGSDQGQLSQQLQQLQQQYQQQQQQHQSLLRAQRAQHQQQLQAGQQEARYQSLVAQQQLLQLQQQQHQVMLQQMTGLPGQMAALGYEPSSAGTLDAGSSVQSSSIASLQSSVVMAGGSSATLRTNIPTGTMDPLWSLPAGTLVLQGDSGSCDLSSSVTALPSVLRQPPGYAGRRPSGDLAAAAAAAAAAAGSELAPAAGLEEMVGSGGSASGLRLQLPPTGLGAAGGVSAATANLMALMGQDAPGQGLYLQGQGGAGEL